MKRCWQIHSLGTRVEAGSQVDDHVDALPNLLLDEFVVRISACDPGPRCALAERHGFRDLVAALARKAPRKWIAENGIGPFRFAGAHPDSLPRFRSLSDSAIGFHSRIPKFSKRLGLGMHIMDSNGHILCISERVDTSRNP